MSYLIERYRITQIYNLATILGHEGNTNPLATWDINIKCCFNILEAARQYKLTKIFFPSSIAVFGTTAQHQKTPQDSIRTPETVEGMIKVATENWCSYYAENYGIDVRSLRYPSVVGFQRQINGGVSDYTIEIFQKAVKEEPYKCFLQPDTRVPMIVVEDVVRATIQLMEAPKTQITVRSAYNLAGLSFTPQELYQEIKKYFPNFSISYVPDFRQKIADARPESIDDSQAKRDWGWQSEYDLSTMTARIIAQLQASHVKKKAEYID
jgi:nucleoside-diphosphate-sugar epimerase